MNHRKSGRILSRGRNQRRALLKSLIGNLIVSGRMETTLAKAKETRDRIDPIINKAKRAASEERAKLSVIRHLAATLPAPALRKLSDVAFLKQFDGRTSGYTRVIRLESRKGDGAEMAVIEFV